MKELPPARVLTVPQLSAEFSISKAKIYELVNEGKIPCVRFGVAIRFRREALEAWLAAQETRA